MRTLVDIDREISKCKIMIQSSSVENKRALDRRIEQLEWERLVVENERGGKLYCDKCNKFVPYSTHLEKQEFSTPKGIVITEITITTCNICGEEVYNRDKEIENDNKVLGKWK